MTGIGFYTLLGALAGLLGAGLLGAGRWIWLRAQRLRQLRDELERRMDELAENEHRTRAIVDNVLDGIITIDERGMIQTFNPAAETIFGYRGEEVIGRNVKMLMPDPDRSRHDSYLRNYLTTGQAKIIGTGREVVGQCRDGSVFPMDLAVSEYRLGDRRMFAGIVRDITERKRAEQTARFVADASAALAALIDYESTLQIIAKLAVPFFADWCTVDKVEEGRLRRLAVAHADPADVELADHCPTICSPSSDVAGSVLHSGEPQLLADIDDGVLRAIARDAVHLEQLRQFGLRSGICVPLRLRGTTIGVISYFTSHSGRVYGRTDLEVARDLAQRASIAIENAQLYEEAREADRRKDEFLAMLAHELRNPLAPIRSGLDLMSMEGVDQETVLWAREMMKEQVEHLVRLVDDLLDVSRITRGKIVLRRQRLDLSTVVTRGVETARPFIESRGHQLLVSLPPEPILLEVDPIRTTQVIANLLNNAAKYNDKPGHIWLTAAREEEQAVIRVRDDGLGIDPTLLPRVFEMFTQIERTLDRSHGGLGIGLTLARRLVEMHGGTIEAQSEGLGRGSQFVVRLPVSSNEEAPDNGKRAPRTAQPLPNAAGRRLLIVDDNVASATTLARIARQWGHEVQAVHDGPAALETAKSFHPDAILLDIGLPGMNGYDVARRLRQQPEFQDTLLIAVTGYGQEEDRRRSRTAGFDHHLVKPLAPHNLAEILAGLPVGTP